jgi:hypothetical protein
MSTKYIVNNVPGQTINGDITINGNLSVTGVTTGSLATYKALLTQLGSQTGTTLGGFGGFNDGLIIGETYEILNYQSGDDFSNIANALSGVVLTYSYSGTAVTGVTNTYTSGGVTSGQGFGIEFDIVINNDAYESVSIVTIGYGYVSGDTITILGTNIGGVSPDNDITITVDSATTENPNETGSVFIAIGELPTNWNNGSTLESRGNLVVKVLENNLGFDIEWVEDFMGGGIYIAFNSITGPLYNTFNRNTTFVLGGNTAIPFFGPTTIETFVLPYTVNEKDDTILFAVFDLSVPEPAPNSLYYFPIEIQILQDTNTTPIVISGTTTNLFPFTNVSIEFYCGDMFIQAFYTSGGTIVNDIPEVVNILNTDTNTSFLGTFSDDGGNIILTMATNLETQFCANSTLIFYVFND